MSMSMDSSRTLHAFGKEISIKKFEHGYAHPGKLKEKGKLEASRKVTFADSWYFLLLDSSYTQMLGYIVLFYAVSAAVFTACAYPLTHIINVGEMAGGENDLLVAFVFSVTHIVTAGYGQFLPADMTSQEPHLGFFLLASAQQFVGIVINVLVFTIIVTKIQHPASAIVFSKKALVCTRNGRPVVLFRVGNLRCNHIFMPDLRVSVLKRIRTSEGEQYMQWVALDVTEVPIMSAVCTVEHELNEESPCTSLLTNRDDFLASFASNQDFALSVTFAGKDSVYHDDVSSAHKYFRDDMVFGSLRFADVMEVTTVGRKRKQRVNVNFEKLGAMVPADLEEEDMLGDIFDDDMDILETSRREAPDTSPATHRSDSHSHSQHIPAFQSSPAYTVVQDTMSAPLRGLLSPDAILGRLQSHIGGPTGVPIGPDVHAESFDTDDGLAQKPACLENPLPNVVYLFTSAAPRGVYRDPEDPEVWYPAASDFFREKFLATSTDKGGMSLLGGRGMPMKACSYTIVVDTVLKAAHIPHRVICLSGWVKPQWYKDAWPRDNLYGPYKTSAPCIFYNGNFMTETTDILRFLVKNFGESHMARYFDLPPSGSTPSTLSLRTFSAITFNLSEGKESSAPADITQFASQFATVSVVWVLKVLQVAQLEEMEKKEGELDLETKEKLRVLRQDELPGMQKNFEELITRANDSYAGSQSTWLYGERLSLDDVILGAAMCAVTSFVSTYYPISTFGFRPSDKKRFEEKCYDDDHFFDFSRTLGLDALDRVLRTFRALPCYRLARPHYRSEVFTATMLRSRLEKGYELPMVCPPIALELERQALEFYVCIQDRLLVPALREVFVSRSEHHFSQSASSQKNRLSAAAKKYIRIHCITGDEDTDRRAHGKPLMESTFVPKECQHDDAKFLEWLLSSSEGPKYRDILLSELEYLGLALTAPFERHCLRHAGAFDADTFLLELGFGVPSEKAHSELDSAGGEKACPDGNTVMEALRELSGKLQLAVVRPEGEPVNHQYSDAHRYRSLGDRAVSSSATLDSRFGREASRSALVPQGASAAAQEETRNLRDFRSQSQHQLDRRFAGSRDLRQESTIYESRVTPQPVHMKSAVRTLSAARTLSTRGSAGLLPTVNVTNAKNDAQAPASTGAGLCL